MLVELPRSFDEWERCLVKYFLSVVPNGDSSPIRAFEITPNTLAAACGVPNELGGEVEVAFRNMLFSDPLLIISLRIGSQRSETNELPNCFSYLVLTLLIDCSIDGDTTQIGEFRSKLAQWLGSNVTLSNLRGVAIMWEFLKLWLTKQIKAGGPYRTLVLPDPGSWTHIGYTRRLSFPSKADIRLVSKFCAKEPTALDDLYIIINKFPPELNESSSWGIRNAFEDFSKGFYLRRRALTELPFWRLLERASALTGRRQRHIVTIEMLFDLDGRALFFSQQKQDYEPEPSTSLGDALSISKAAFSENLATGVTSGLFFFRLIGAGRWLAESQINHSNIGLHVAVSERHNKKIGRRLELIDFSDNWLITAKPISVDIIQDVLRETGFTNQRLERVIRPTIIGGIRTDGYLLGRQHFLPNIYSDTCDYAIRRVTSNSSDEELEINNGRINSKGPFEGAFIIHPVLEPTEEHVPWSLRLQFTQNAFVHNKLDGVRYKLPPINDWLVGKATCIQASKHIKLSWEHGKSQCEDLLEAVYANGRSGWEESQLISLLDSADDVISPWLLLKSLSDSGFITPRLRAGWKGRVWTLNEPSIIEVNYDKQVLTVVEGALCLRMIEAFQLAVKGFGGTSFRHLGVTSWAPPVVGAFNVSPRLLAEHLGWRFDEFPVVPLEKALAFEDSNRLAMHYGVAGHWSWSVRRFSKQNNTNNSTQLTRLTHLGGRDHDIYRVEHKDKIYNYLSRTAALMSAHALAKVPLLSWDDTESVLVAENLDGGIPNLLASEIRRRMLRNGGPSDSRYLYPINKDVVHWLSALLPCCIAGNFLKGSLDSYEMASRARRSFGRLRLQWVNSTTNV